MTDTDLATLLRVEPPDEKARIRAVRKSLEVQLRTQLFEAASKRNLFESGSRLTKLPKEEMTACLEKVLDLLVREAEWRDSKTKLAIIDSMITHMFGAAKEGVFVPGWFDYFIEMHKMAGRYDAYKRINLAAAKLKQLADGGLPAQIASIGLGYTESYAQLGGSSLVLYIDGELVAVTYNAKFSNQPFNAGRVAWLEEHYIGERGTVTCQVYTCEKSSSLELITEYKLRYREWPYDSCRLLPRVHAPIVREDGTLDFRVELVKEDQYEEVNCQYPPV